MHWCVASMADAVKCKFTTAAEFAIRGLTGRGMGNKGTLDLFVYKFKLLNHLAGTFLDSQPFDPVTKTVYRTLKTHAMWRAKFGYPGDKGVDKSRLGQLGESGRMLMEVTEQAVSALPMTGPSLRDARIPAL
eukprot:11520902-Alexandrium_andersonii.AAC.1